MRAKFPAALALLVGILLPTDYLLEAQTQSTAGLMNRIGIENSEELAKMISDPNIRIQDKEEAVFRMGELSRQLPSHPEISPSKLFNPLLGVLIPQSSVQDHHILRVAACNALGRFAGQDGAESIVQPLGKVVRNQEEKEEVRMAAGLALSRFYKNSAAAASEELIAALNQEVDRGAHADNVRVTTQIVVSLGMLGDRRAFVPLMRVLRSNFPTDTKNKAQ
ncbi:MAG: hypothetical protein KDK30_05170, partial [Leptospiraceae bacterium]|nr:hypothetical protein [Leptospiraceae bacterium]